jgi:hypothetical protein
MRGGGLTPGILAVWALPLASCDPPLCRSEQFVAVSTTTILGDVDDFAPGVQADIDVHSSLLPGDRLTLEVLDESGASRDTLSRSVGVDGGARFDFVTLPVPRAVLRASGHGVCGVAHDEVMLDVPPPLSCDLVVAPAPVTSAFYAPFGVLNLKTDLEPAKPGLQTQVQVGSRPGWTVEVLRTTAGAIGEQPLGMFIVGADGVARAPVTLPDGWATLRAVCHGDGKTLGSTVLTVLADTTPPRCQLVAPVPGTTITWDDDHDPRDGVQFTVTARAADRDIAGEPVSVAIVDARGTTVSTASTAMGGDGIASNQMTVIPLSSPARYTAALTMHDHAGNACVAIAAYSVAQ